MNDAEFGERWQAIVEGLQRHGLDALWDRLGEMLRSLDPPSQGVVVRPETIHVTVDIPTPRVVVGRAQLLQDDGVLTATGHVSGAQRPERIDRELVRASIIAVLVVYTAWAFVLPYPPSQAMQNLMEGILIALGLGFASMDGQQDR